MDIIIKSTPNNLFARTPEIKVFNDDKGHFDDAMAYISLMICCERNIEIKVETTHTSLVDKMLHDVATMGF